MDDPHTRHYVSAFVGVSRAVAAIASLGLLQPVKTAPFADKIGLTPAAKAEKQEMFASARHNRVSDEEVETWAVTARQAREAGQYDPSWPVAVITAEHGDGAAWKPQHDAAAIASNHGYIQEVQGSEHASLLGLRFADHIVRGITYVMDMAALPPGSTSPLMDLDAPETKVAVASAP